MQQQTNQLQKRLCLKVILLGDSGVGKTSLLDRYVNNKFSDQYKATIGSDFLTKEITIGNDVISLQIWDTAGQERFRGLGSAFYRGADSCIIVYDVNVKKTFDNIGNWQTEFFTQGAPKDPSSFPLAVIGNKIDLNERAVSPQIIDAWVEKSGSAVTHYEASAKDDINVEKVFRNIIERVVQSYTARSEVSFYSLKTPKTKLAKEMENEGGCC